MLPRIYLQNTESRFILQYYLLCAKTTFKRFAEYTTVRVYCSLSSHNDCRPRPLIHQRHMMSEIFLNRSIDGTFMPKLSVFGYHCYTVCFLHVSFGACEILSHCLSPHTIQDRLSAWKLVAPSDCTLTRAY